MARRKYSKRYKKTVKDLKQIYNLPKVFDGHVSQLSWIYDEELKLREMLADDKIVAGTIQHKRTIDGIDKLEKQRLAITKELNVVAGYQSKYAKKTSSDVYEKVSTVKAREAANAKASMPADHPLAKIRARQNGQATETQVENSTEAVDGGAQLE